jgi:hypothetical protein
MASPIWDRAGTLPVPYATRPRAELPALSAATLPEIGELFTFMRDAELRFGALRMRIEERTATAAGEHLVVMDLVLRHPGDAKVTTSEPSRGTAGNYEIWVSDGETVRTYSAPHKLGTQRPVRHTIRGVAGNTDLPGSSRVYWPLTPLPTETVPDLFVHPAGYCQNVLATGRCWVAATAEVRGREAILVECDHPRTVEVVADRPDFHISLSVDRETGCILRLIETIGGRVTRDATAVDFQPDAPLPPSAFDFRFPSDTTTIY